MSSPAGTPGSQAKAQASRSSLPPDQRHAQKSRFRTMAFARKRAVTACESCRARKTKCDNQRPRCAACIKNSLECSYDPRLDHSSFDPASLMILERLGEMSRKIDSLGSAGTPSVQSRHSHAETGSAASTRAPERLNVNDPDDCLEVLSPYASTDYLLTWPIFAGRWPADLFSRELYNRTFGSDQPAEPSYSAHGRQKPRISEEDVPELIDRYLHYVYPKNPLFYSSKIREQAKRIAEDGFGWDSESCLMLLACALGAISMPFVAAFEAGQLHNRRSVDEAADRRQTAEVYFLAARKRMGLLEPSLITSQCHMLSGIYLMYTLRQIQGWTAFNQAGSSLALYLKGQAALEGHHETSGPDQSDKRLSQRLYWTVLKSECELRTELDFPQSDLCRIGYPYPFPSPPSPRSPSETPQMHIYTPTPPSTTGASSHNHPTPSSIQGVEEQSWFYYLSEIALRRIENRVLNMFYREDHFSWTRTNIEDMMSAAMAIEEQLDSWHSSLPDPIRYDNLDSEEDLDELRLVTHGRERGIRDILYRPFLYHAVHSTHSLSAETRKAREDFVEKALASCLGFLRGLSITHRHHGTWYMMRSTTTAGLMLVAAQMRGLITWKTPADVGVEARETKYGAAMRVCVEALRYWEAESPDIVRAREVIEGLMASSS